MATAAPAYNPPVGGSTLPITLDTVNNRVGLNNTTPAVALALGDTIGLGGLNANRQIAIGQLTDGGNASFRMGQSGAGISWYWVHNGNSPVSLIETDGYSWPLTINCSRLGLQTGTSSGTGMVGIGIATIDTDAVSKLRIFATQPFGVSGASFQWNAVDVMAATLTLSGSTNITTATGVNLLSVAQPTISAGTALTITNAATVCIADAPAGAGVGPATITNAYALWVRAGATRLGGNVGFFAAAPAAQQTSGANLTNNMTSGGTTDQVDTWTNLTTYSTDAAAIRNAVYQLAKKVKQINDGLRVFGLFT